MDDIGLFFFAMGLGFFAAIPIGGSQIEAAKRAITGHLGAAWAVVLGSVSSDIMYGVIALFGIAPFFEVPIVLAIFSAVGAVVLWALAYWTIKEGKKPHEVRMEKQGALGRKGKAYLTGFSLAVSNPPMILTWLYGVTLARHLGLVNQLTTGLKVLFIFGGALGLATYLGLLSVILHKVKHFIPLKTLGKVYSGMGIALLILSLYFVYAFLRYLIKVA